VSVSAQSKELLLSVWSANIVSDRYAYTKGPATAQKVYWCPECTIMADIPNYFNPFNLDLF